MTMTLVSTSTVGAGGVATIEFANIPQTGIDLLLLVNTRAGNFNGELKFNSSSSGYYYKSIIGSGTGLSSTGGTNDTRFQITTLHEPKDFNGTDNTTGIFSNGSIYIANYASGMKKPISIEVGMGFYSSESYMNVYDGYWDNTAAITSIQINTTSGNILENSVISLYTIS